jgi:hypothetical protein
MSCMDKNSPNSQSHMNWMKLKGKHMTTHHACEKDIVCGCILKTEPTKDVIHHNDPIRIL